MLDAIHARLDEENSEQAWPSLGLFLLLILFVALGYIGASISARIGR
jgi:fatty acid desaturase